LQVDKKSGQETGLDGGKAVAFLSKLKYSKDNEIETFDLEMQGVIMESIII
jgi:hypothetical protein